MKKSFIAFISLLALNSCIVDDENREDFLTKTPSFYGFTESEDINVFLPTNTDVVTNEVFVARESSDNGNIEAQIFTFSLNQTHPALKILNSGDVLSINAGGVVSAPLQYEVDPNLIAIGDNLTVTVTLTPNTASTQIIDNTFDIILQKCDPALVGTFTESGNFTNDDEEVSIIALDCDGNYQASNMAPFNGTFSWTFNHNQSDNTITIFGTLAAFPNKVSGTGSYNPTTGVISFNNVSVEGTGIQGYNFTLTP